MHSLDGVCLMAVMNTLWLHAELHTAGALVRRPEPSCAHQRIVSQLPRYVGWCDLEGKVKRGQNRDGEGWCISGTGEGQMA